MADKGDQRAHQGDGEKERAPKSDKDKAGVMRSLAQERLAGVLARVRARQALKEEKEDLLEGTFTS